MSSVKNGKKKDIKIILLGILVGLVVCGAGIYGVVSSRIASHEYKNIFGRFRLLSDIAEKS